MDVTRHTTTSPEETRNLGRNLSAHLGAGDCVALLGDLGSGKTCMIQGICEGLGVARPVTSPSFILVNEYTGEDAAGNALPVYHFDLYRLSGPDDVVDLGWDDYVDRGGVCLIEWSDRAAELLPARTVTVEIEAPERCVRHITLKQGA